MIYSCNGTRSSSLALAVSQARATVLAGQQPVAISNGLRSALVWRHDNEWVVALVDMLPTNEQVEFKDKVVQLLRDHG